MNTLASLPYLTVRVPVVFFDDFAERCDDAEAFEVESTEGRIYTISAPADGVLELYADALRTADPRTAPVGTEAHVSADARRAVSLLDASVSWLRRDAAVLAGRASAHNLGFAPA